VHIPCSEGVETGRPSAFGTTYARSNAERKSSKTPPFANGAYEFLPILVHAADMSVAVRHFPHLTRRYSSHFATFIRETLMRNTIWTVLLTLGLLLSGCASLASVSEPQPATTTPVDGVDGTAPIIRVVSPVPSSSVTRGSGREGAGSEDGSGFVLNLEIVTRDDTPITLREATFGAPPENPTAGIRHAELVGRSNPDVPGLTVSVDVDLIKPDGGTIPAHANLASLFNIAGTDDTPGPGVTAWLGWHVLESLPEDVETFTITATITDESGRTSADQASYRVADEWTSGQALTPAPEPLEAETTLHSTTFDADGPEVTMIAPRVPTSVAPGPEGTPPAGTGSLHFIQVAAVDRSGAGIGVKEGIVFDPANIPNPDLNGGTAAPNSNYPGLFLAFDVPLRQPNGNLVPAGTNLAPIFDIAGSELDTDGSVRTTADWVVGGSLELPAGKSTVTITARVTDNDGKTGGVTQVVGVSAVEDGQDLTANP